MNTFKIHEKYAKLPKIIEVEKIIIRDSTNDISNPFGGILYSGNGVLIYKGAGGRITYVAQSS
jgi:hypothetical protein